MHEMIRSISGDKARDLFVEMGGMEKYPIDELVGTALYLYSGEFGGLKERLGKLYEKLTDDRAKRRIGEFERKLEQALKLHELRFSL